MSSEQARWAVLAKIIRPQGRRGEVLAELLTDFPETLVGRQGLFLAAESFDGPETEAQPCTITGMWLPKGKNEGRVVLAVGGVETIDEAERLAGLDVLVRTEERLALEDGSVYVSELVGCRVLDGEREIGVVREVQFPTTADGRRRLEDAAPLLVVEQQVSGVDGGGKEVLVPFVRSFLIEVNAANRLLRMHLPEGLLDLDEPGGAGKDQTTDEPFEA